MIPQTIIDKFDLTERLHDGESLVNNISIYKLPGLPYDAYISDGRPSWDKPVGKELYYIFASKIVWASKHVVSGHFPEVVLLQIGLPFVRERLDDEFERLINKQC